MSLAQGGLLSSPESPTTFGREPVVYLTASIAQVAALQAAGTPVPLGTMLLNPTTRKIYGQSDGIGGYSPLGGAVTTTVAGLAAMALAATLTPGTYIDEYGMPYVAVTASVYYPLGTAQHIGRMSLAAVLAYPAPVHGMTAVATGIGNRDVRLEYDSIASVWRPFGGRQLALRLPAPIGRANASGQTGTEEAMPGGQWTFPIGILGANGMGFEWVASADKTGVANSPTLRARFGPLGTTADPTLFGPWTFATTTVGQGGFGAANRDSATSLRLEGSGAVGAQDRFNGGSTTARPAAITTGNLNVSGGAANFLTLTTTGEGTFADWINMTKLDLYLVG